MWQRMKLLLGAAAIALAPGMASAKTTIEVQYPYGFIFDKVFEEIKADFEKQNPDIEVKYR